MDFDETEKNFIDILAAQEEGVSSLYHQYSLAFTDNSFWKELSVDESIHKSWVMALYSSREKIFIDQQHFEVEAIQSNIAYINKLKTEIKQHSLVETLTLVLDIEKSFIEKDCFKVFESDSAEVKRILAQLETATIEHIHKIEVELNITRNS